jgi:type II secretion system protein L
MAKWADILGDLAPRMPWVPEPLLLPVASAIDLPVPLLTSSPGPADEWTLVIEAESALLRYGPCEGTRIERSLLPALLEALLNEAAPARIILYGDDEASDRAALPSLSLSSLSSQPPSVEWRRGGVAAAMLLTDTAIPAPNLLQGEFAAQLPYARWWAQWRMLAAVLLLALGAHLVSGWLDFRRLEQENLALRGDIQTLYRSVNPRGAISDVEKQLRNQLDELRGGETGEPFISLLDPLARLAAQRSGVVFSSLNYNQRSGQLRLNLLAPSFAEIEGLRASLVAGGFDTTLENSSRSGGQVRARLRLETRA